MKRDGDIAMDISRRWWWNAFFEHAKKRERMKFTLNK